MAEYIEREALLKAMSYHNYYPKGKHFLKGIETAEEIIEHFPAADVQPVKWIPVTERLPESPFGCLLVVWDSTYNRDDFLNLLPYFAGWDGEQWNDADGEQIPFEVEYWMPLPEPPKDGET